MTARYELVLKDRHGVVHREPFSGREDAFEAALDIANQWLARGLEVWQVSNGFQAVDEDDVFLASATFQHGPDYDGPWA